MIRQYISHSFRLLKETPVLSTITIFGATLAVSMVLVTMMVRRLECESIYPETFRDRTMYINTIKCRQYGDTLGNSYSSGRLSTTFIKDVLLDIKEAEAMTAYVGPMPAVVNSPGARPYNMRALGVDSGFWQVNTFHFIVGSPFSEADFASAITKAVLSEQAARTLFGNVDVVGREFYFDYTSYVVAGVVKDVPTLAHNTWADMWVPYTIYPLQEGKHPAGALSVAYLLKDARKSTKEAFRAAVDKRIAQYNSRAQSPEDYEVTLMGQPDEIFTHSKRFYSNKRPDMVEINRKYYITIVVLLLVPCLNLIAIMSSRMRKRVVELGIRRSFGASRSEIVRQVLAEGLVQTLISGVLGIVVAIISMMVARNLLFTSEYASSGISLDSISITQLLAPLTILWALFLCLVINVLTTLLPALQAARRPIVTSLTSKR